MVSVEAVSYTHLDVYKRQQDMRCGTDNLIVERAEAARTITFESINSLPPDLDVYKRQGNDG